MLHFLPEPIKHWLDAAGILTALAAFFEKLPEYINHTSAFLALLYLGVRLYETETVKSWFKKKEQ
jgi:hypothetical protein